jgi:parallel beta-helix repeat protein
MKLSLSFLIVCLLLFPAFSFAVEVSGPVWGRWTVENSPYDVVGELRVPPESTLIIDPGVVVNFKAYYKFIVDSSATLLAVGTQTDSVYFTPEDTTVGWHGIRFLHAALASRLSHCQIRYGRATGTAPDNNGGGVFCYYSSPRISNSSIVENQAMENGFGGGIYCYHSNCEITASDISFNKATPTGGGIYAIYSDLTVTDNSLVGNMAWGSGGGIYCVSSDLVSSSNSFTDNWSYHGGGIYCFSAGVEVNNNLISDNWICHLGGGIYVGNCDGVINDNIISGNNAQYGAGVYCDYRSTVTIINNLIENNSTAYGNDDGGGIYCDISSPEILYNVMVGNSAQRYGGGIYLWGSSPLIKGNSMSMNTAQYGGGICCHDSSFVTITNNILWEDSAEVGMELCLLYDAEAIPPVVAVSYSDVEGGEGDVYVAPEAELFWEYGNLDIDPLFVDPAGNDFHLLPTSPCIDVGDPYLEDYDHSRSDMGALAFFHQIALRLRPDDLFPLSFPPGYNAYGMRSIANNSASPKPVKLSAVITNSAGDTLRNLYSWEGNLPREYFREDYGYLHIPSYAPPGFYNYVMVAKNAITGEIWHISVTPFEISEGGAIATSDEGWLSQFGEKSSRDQEVSFISSEADFNTSCYPNPFNASTTISYQLPVDGHVRLAVYNALGQKVAVLVDEEQQAGYRSVVWDAAEVSSGLYFYSLTAGEKTSTGMTVLIK